MEPAILKNKRAEYGNQIVVLTIRQLTEKYGKGWDDKTLRHCLRSAETIARNGNLIKNETR